MRKKWEPEIPQILFGLSSPLLLILQFLMYEILMTPPPWIILYWLCIFFYSAPEHRPESVSLTHEFLNGDNLVCNSGTYEWLLFLFLRGKIMRCHMLVISNKYLSFPTCLPHTEINLLSHTTGKRRSDFSKSIFLLTNIQ